MRRTGFTVFEVVVTIAIIVLVIISSVPYIRSSQQNSSLRREARSLMNDIRLAQQLTIGEQTTHLIKIFNTTPYKYQIIKRTTSDTLIKEHILNSKVSWQETGNFTNNEIIFTFSGGVTESGTIILINTANQTSSLEIKPSGYVKINY